MKKTKLLLCAFALMLAATSAVHATGGPPSDIGASILERLIEVLTRLSDIVPSFLQDFFLALIGFFESLFGF